MYRSTIFSPSAITPKDLLKTVSRHGRAAHAPAQIGSARTRPTITTDEYARLAAFRLAVRTFLHFSEEAAAQVGLTGQHYQALLVLRACPADQPCTINDLAQQLFLRHNSTVALVDRLEADGLLVRIPSTVDRRKVELRITASGTRVLGKLAQRHRSKLKVIGSDLEAFFRELSLHDSAGGKHAIAKPPRGVPKRRRADAA